MSDYFHSNWDDEIGHQFSERVNDNRAEREKAINHFNDALEKISKALERLSKPI